MKLLTDVEAAEKLRITVGRLAELRRARCPEVDRVPFVSLSPRCIRYPEAALDEWLERRITNKPGPRPVKAVHRASAS